VPLRALGGGVAPDDPVMVRGASRSKDRPPAPSAARRRPRLQCGGQGRGIQCRRSVGL